MYMTYGIVESMDECQLDNVFIKYKDGVTEIQQEQLTEALFNATGASVKSTEPTINQMKA